MSAGTSADFPISITPAENDAGFLLLRIENPHAPADNGSVLELYATVRPIDVDNQLLKVRSSDGRIGYLHRQRVPSSSHNTHGPTGELLWRTVSGPHFGLDEALKAAGAE